MHGNCVPAHLSLRSAKRGTVRIIQPCGKPSYRRTTWYDKSGWPAPDGHPRRCQEFSRSTLKQCKNWALIDKEHCAKHASLRNGVGLRMSKHYGKYLNARLQDVVANAAAQPIAQLAQLNEELALMRDLAGQAVQLYSAVELMPGDTDEQRSKRDAAKILAGGLMQEQLNAVANLCEKAIRIDSMASDKLGAHNVKLIADQITSMAWRCFGELPDQTPVLKFTEMLAETIKVNVGPQGTALTPDAEVSEMDASIPR